MKGLSISPGYALGKIYCLKHFQLDNLPTETIAAGDTEAEIERFKVALDISRNEITQMLDMPQIKSSAEISSIFQAHLTLIDDPDLSKEITKRIKEQQQDCQSAVSKVIRDYSTFFRNLPDPQFQSKAIDILDIGKRILKNCQKSKNPTTKLEELEEGMKPDDEFCTVCGWNYDEKQLNDFDLKTELNSKSINEYRKWFNKLIEFNCSFILKLLSIVLKIIF